MPCDARRPNAGPGESQQDERDADYGKAKALALLGATGRWKFARIRAIEMY
jgi:hypothetical protein